MQLHCSQIVDGNLSVGKTWKKAVFSEDAIPEPETTSKIVQAHANGF